MSRKIEITDEELEALLTGDENDDDDDGDENDGDAGDADSGTGSAGDENDPAGAAPNEADPLADLTEAQRAAVEAKIAKANANAKKWRLAAKGDKAPSPATMPKTKATDNKTAAPSGDPAADLEAVRAQVRAELESEYSRNTKVSQVSTEAATALVAAGLALPDDKAKAKRALAKAVKMLDLDPDMDADDVASEVDDLRATMPGLFGSRPTKRRGSIGGPSKTDSGSRKVDPIAALFE